LPPVYNEIFQEAEVTLQHLISINKFEGDLYDNKLYWNTLDALTDIIDEYVYDNLLKENEVMDQDWFGDVLYKVRERYPEWAQRESQDNEIAHPMERCHACRRGKCTYIKKYAAKSLLRGVFKKLFNFGASPEDKIGITRGFDPTQIMDDFKETLKIFASISKKGEDEEEKEDEEQESEEEEESESEEEEEKGAELEAIRKAFVEAFDIVMNRLS